MITLGIFLSIIALLILYFIVIYNNLIKLRNLTQEGWSGIDVQLKQRADLIPNLVESVKGYMAHERTVLEKVTELRNQAQAIPTDNIQQRAAVENQLTGVLRQLFAVAENYPDLKASQNFMQLQNSLANIENQIQLARRYYNGSARDLNIAIQSFPSNIVANHFQFKTAEFFTVDDPAERNAPNVTFS